MLDNETNLDSGSIQWLDGEDAFVILDQNKFEKVCSIRSATLDAIVSYYTLTLYRILSFICSFFQDIIPKYFTPIIFQSFLRKLYRWGFKRITTSHAGNYKFASATFTRSPVPSAASHDAAGPSGIAFGQIPFQQAAAVHAQPNQLIPLLAQLQQSLQPPVQPQPEAQYNEFGTLLANAISRQQQSREVLQQMLLQQIVYQSMHNSVPSNAYVPALNQYIMSTYPYGAPSSQDPLVSFLNQNQSLNPYAPPVRTLPSSEQALALLTRNIQNAATAANGTNQNSGNALDASERSSSTVTAEPRVMLPPSQPDPSSKKTQSKRKRKH